MCIVQLAKLTLESGCSSIMYTCEFVLGTLLFATEYVNKHVTSISLLGKKFEKYILIE